MAWTQTDLDSLEAAILAAGVNGYAELRSGDKGLVRYSLKELLDLRTVVKAAVNGSDASNYFRSTYGTFAKG